MPIKPKKAKKVLADKGFREEKDRDHSYWFFYFEGRKTNCYTYFSHGSNNEIDNSLLKRMKRELQLDYDNQVKNLLECPLTEQDLVEILSDKGYI